MDVGPTAFICILIIRSTNQVIVILWYHLRAFRQSISNNNDKKSIRLQTSSAFRVGIYVPMIGIPTNLKCMQRLYKNAKKTSIIHKYKCIRIILYAALFDLETRSHCLLKHNII